MNKAQRGDGLLAKKKRDVFCRKYGVTSPAKNRAVVEKARLTCIERFGGWPQQNAEIAKKRVSTCIERYGTTNSFQIQSVRAHANTVAACQKRHETMKRSGSYAKSGPEDEFDTLLCDAFGVDNIERQVKIIGTRWAIDFYIKPIYAYVQFDGVYWHGLDRPIEQIRESTNPRDRSIARKWDVDRIQDAWFAAHKERLVRITDMEFRTRGIDCLEMLK